MLRRTCLVAATAALLPRPSLAQAYPSRPVRIIVPYAPGGSTDLMARLIGERLTRSLGQPFVVENRAGASEQVGAQALTQAPADGHTIMMATTIGLSVNPSLFRRLPYDPETDFQPILPVAKIASVLVVNAALPVSNLTELAAFMRTNRVNYASAGAGAPSHLAMELYKRAAGVDATHVPYRGGAPALQDLAAGNVQVMIALVSEAMPLVRSGNLKALAITSPTRSARYPELPPVSDVAGMAGFEIYLWYGLVVRAGTPAPIAARLNEAVNAVLNEPAVRERLADMDIEVEGGSAAHLSGIVRAEREKWGRVIREADIRVD